MRCFPIFHRTAYVPNNKKFAPEYLSRSKFSNNSSGHIGESFFVITSCNGMVQP